MPKRIPTYRPPGSPAPGESQRHYNRYRRDKVLKKLYGSARWQRFRAMIRRDRVLCERCKGEGKTVVGTFVHHLVDPRDDMGRAFDPENVLLLCLPCHNRTHGEQGRRARG